VLATYGDTVVLCTAVGEASPRPNIDFFPLTVNYQEKTFAAGKIPGGFFKREGRPSEKETLTSRLIDRPLRPLFAEGYKNETQVICTVLSHDLENDPDIVAMVGASAALTISGIPFLGPIAGCRVGYKDGEYLLNPRASDLEESELDLILAGTSEGVLMVESEADELSETVMLGAVDYGHKAMEPVLEAIIRLAEACAKEPRELSEPVPEVASVRDKFAAQFSGQLTQAYQEPDKMARHEKVGAVKNAAIESLGEAEAELAVAGKVFKSLESEIVRGTILKTGKRIDGRTTSDVRRIDCQVGVLPLTHGSALFTRGETQALVTTTLGTGQDEQIIDALEGEYREHFLLHYNFPYTIRVVSEITESNGSSSMATVCGSSLAMMDAGVPLTRPVAGIAMGLIKDGDEFAVLSDILGDEDHLGDMDFKVAGTDAGITSLQMDIKITSITTEIMEIALNQARDGRLHILGEMAKALDHARDGVSDHAPRITVIQIPKDKIREVIGTGGKVIREICETTGAKIDIEDDGTIKVAAVDQSQGEAAIDWIRSITAEPEVGRSPPSIKARARPPSSGSARSPPSPRSASSTGARWSRSWTSAPSCTFSGRATAWSTSPNWPRSGSVRSTTWSRRATRSGSRSSAWTTAAR
jgi:polyribonucleotide nucleotidyltransferase